MGTAAAVGLAGCSYKKQKPNFVFILVDDLGYNDIGAYNPDTFYETPNINKLAQNGVRFTDGYAANPVCSPTRYSIMTGKYPSRVDATNWFSGKRSGKFMGAPLNDKMPLEEVTIAESLKEHGYKTTFIGKWHLGESKELWPQAQGFDKNIGGWKKGSPSSYFSPYNNPVLPDGPDGEYLTERLTNEALNVLEHAGDDPFFLYLAFYTVHIPLQAIQHLIVKYEKKAESITGPEFAEEEQIWPTEDKRKVRILQKKPVYAAMVEYMDTSVGRVVDKLADLGLHKNTVVCFMSDNGGLSTAEGLPTSNLPLRAGKGWLYEGGIREPFIINWPDAKRNSHVCNYPVISTDFYPTILDIAGIPLCPDQHMDGLSLVPLLNGEKSLDRQSLYWHYPHYSNQGGMPGGAIREGKYKLIESLEDGGVKLFDLDLDIGEQNNLAESMPDLVKEMSDRLHKWYKTVDAKFLQAKPGGPQPWRPE